MEPSQHFDRWKSSYGPATVSGGSVHQGDQLVQNTFNINVGDVPESLQQTYLQLYQQHLRSLQFFDYPRTSLKTWHYVDRPKISQTLDGAAKIHVAGEPTVVVLSGMGGQGKTKLAINFCTRSELSGIFRVILWFDATNQCTLNQSIERLCFKLRIPIQEQGEKPSYYDTWTSELIDSIGNYLRDWLLVFDNCDNPEELQRIQDYFPTPRNGRGMILITTRSQSLNNLGIVVDVTGFSQDEAILLLTKNSEQNEDEDALRVATALGFLPLAIDQARAYIQGPPKISFQKFLRLFEKRKQHVLETVPHVWNYWRRDGSSQKQYLSAFTTWELSLNLLEVDTYGSRRSKEALLEMLACLDNRSISLEMFGAPQNRKGFFKKFFGGSLPTVIGDLRVYQNHPSGAWDFELLEGALRKFLVLSLVSDVADGVDIDVPKIALHPLVRDWIRLRAEKQRISSAYEAAVRLIVNCCSAHLNSLSSEGKPLCVCVTPHVAHSIGCQYPFCLTKEGESELVQHLIALSTYFPMEQYNSHQEQAKHHLKLLRNLRIERAKAERSSMIQQLVTQYGGNKEGVTHKTRYLNH